MTHYESHWDLRLHPQCARTLKSLERADLRRIDKALLELARDPLAGDNHLLHGVYNIRRKRVGDWRIIFKVETVARLVLVLDIVRRSSTTY